MKQSLPLLAAMEKLADGEWHDMTDVLLAAMNQVEYPKAIRRAERIRRNSLPPGKQNAPRKKKREDWQLVQFGARSIAREAILKCPRFQLQWLADDGTWVDDPAKAKKNARARIRLRPDYVYGARRSPEQAPAPPPDPALEWELYQAG